MLSHRSRSIQVISHRYGIVLADDLHHNRTVRPFNLFHNPVRRVTAFQRMLITLDVLPGLLQHQGAGGQALHRKTPASDTNRLLLLVSFVFPLSLNISAKKSKQKTARVQPDLRSYATRCSILLYRHSVQMSKAVFHKKGVASPLANMSNFPWKFLHCCQLIFHWEVL